jgi:all-trans-retinol dehydrogenase (NAD+)
MKSLKDTNIVITGAAAGIGKEMALLFAREKANLALLDLNGKKLAELATRLEADGVRVGTWVCDVSDPKAVEKTSKLVKKFFEVDILVNNAGIVIGKSIADSTYNDIRKTIDVNLMGLIWMTKQFLPDMMKRGSGHIVNIASAAGLLAVPRMADYCATKFAIVGFTDSLRMEMYKEGHGNIHITCVCPSVIDTGMFTGFKAPMFNPILKPTEVARKIVAGVKKNRTYIKLPAMVKITPLLKFFPAPFGDWLARVTGVTKAMDHFVGH